ncbi:hypothetical protein [Paraliobacillus zengyii]|uniref:hypothetical protein n=1 Tax=Paraliobacillus zengyii TaxID=2213194 RepID=UPI000E3D2E60|nr:hypothetical protein [Paraliobacillus zengyii]
MISLKEEYLTDNNTSTKDLKSMEILKYTGAFQPFLTIDVLNRLGAPKNLITIALSLLEENMTFEFISKKSNEIANLLESKSKAKYVELYNADTIFVSDGLNAIEINEIITSAFPEERSMLTKQTTFVIAVKRLGKDLCSSGLRLFIDHQDKQDFTICDVEGLPFGWIAERQLINNQFPNEMSLILIDQFNKYIYIPSHALIEVECF